MHEIAWPALYVSWGRLFDKASYFLGEKDDSIKMREDFLMQYYSSKDSIPKDILLDEDITNGEIIEKFLRHKYDHAVNISTPKRGQFLHFSHLLPKVHSVSLHKSRQNEP